MLTSFNNIDLQLNQLLNAIIENVTALPTASSAVKGRVVFNTTDNIFYYCNGTEWVKVQANTDEKVTSADNHYTPSGTTAPTLNTATTPTTNSVEVVSQVKGDAKGHIVSQDRVNVPTTKYVDDKIGELGNDLQLYYGIQWNIPQSGDTNISVTRIGNGDLHKSLPLQNQMKRCLLSDDGKVLNYLHATDSNKLSTGVVADLTGVSGMVEVEMPDTYYKFEEDSAYGRCLLSPYPLPGFRLWKKKYISAYEASVSRTTLTLASVVNDTAEYRGGDNTASWDETYRSLLGRPVTNLSTVEFMNYARKRGAGWYSNLYEAHVQMFWLFAVEFCTFNSQAVLGGASKSYVQQADGSKYAITNAQGLMDGGLGDGVSTLSGAEWSFNSYNPFVPCGMTNVLGNRTGTVQYTITNASGDTIKTVEVPSYRGIENPFGHIWEWTEGAKVVTVSGAGKLYVAEDLTSQSLADDNTNVSGYRFAGDLPATDGYIKNILGGEYGDILAKEIGGSASSFFYDYFYQSTSPCRVCAVGGDSYDGTLCGLGCVAAYRVPSSRFVRCGSRLCFQA